MASLLTFVHVLHYYNKKIPSSKNKFFGQTFDLDFLLALILFESTVVTLTLCSHLTTAQR